ncbi:MAG: hypothetical protein H6Q74_2535 [Firmicutes bacterium]|nr:hypothetical protein [Bacillota bacterium]
MEKKKGLFLTIAVLLLSLVNIDVGLVNVVVGELGKVFPDVDPSWFSFIMTLPPVIMIPCSLLAGRLCYYYSKNSILICGLIIYIIGGVGGAFINNSIYQVLFMRTIFGIGAGIVVPLGTAIIADLYDELDRAKMMGWSNSFGAVVVIVMSMLAAFLCVINWKYTFLAYLLFVAILIIEIMALPYMPPERTYKTKTQTGSLLSIARDAAPGLVLALIVLASMFMGIILMLKLPIFIIQQGIGDAVTTATTINAYSISAFAMGVTFKYVYKVLRNYTLPLCFVFMALGYILMMNAHSIYGTCFAMFVNGIGGGMFMPYIFTKATVVSSQANRGLVIAIVFDALFLGQFLGSFIEPSLKAMFGDASIQFLYTLGAAGFGVYVVIGLIWAALASKKSQDDTTAAVQ